VRHKEEIEAAINDLTLLNKALIDIRTLGRIVYEGLLLLILGLLEEALSHPLVHNDKRDLRPLSLVTVTLSIQVIDLELQQLNTIISEEYGMYA
jgi:hypothetical protein